MCLAVPAKIISRDGDDAVADLHGNQVPVSTALVPDVEVGQWVLVHAGFAIQVLDCQTLEETWAVLEDLAAAENQAGGAL